MIYGGVLASLPDRGPAVLRFLRDYMAGAPDDLGLAAAFLSAPPEPFVPKEMHFAPVCGWSVPSVSGPWDVGASPGPIDGLPFRSYHTVCTAVKLTTSNCAHSERAAVSPGPAPTHKHRQSANEPSDRCRLELAQRAITARMRGAARNQRRTRVCHASFAPGSEGLRPKGFALSPGPLARVPSACACCWDNTKG
jgi:hypothetical protein